jgi:phospholipase C
MAGTAAGIVSTSTAALTAPPPPNGTIFDRFHSHGISWRNYYTDAPSAAIILKTLTDYPTNFSNIDQFYADAASGALPSFSLVDPNFGTESEENPQDLRVGEQMASKVVNAVMQSPAWPRTMLIWTYDEHGGYYDHVPPPPAPRPDDIPPDIEVPPDLPGAYDRYSFRVPAAIISPYSRRNYVSHVVHDHTSVLKLVETKWNLGAMTYRDANADNLLDSLDLHGRPAFLEPPPLPAPALAAGPDLCVPGDPGGPIPPPDAVVPLATNPWLMVHS